MNSNTTFKQKRMTLPNKKLYWGGRTSVQGVNNIRFLLSKTIQLLVCVLYFIAFSFWFWNPFFCVNLIIQDDHNKCGWFPYFIQFPHTTPLIDNWMVPRYQVQAPVGRSEKERGKTFFCLLFIRIYRPLWILIIKYLEIICCDWHNKPQHGQAYFTKILINEEVRLIKVVLFIIHVSLSNVYQPMIHYKHLLCTTSSYPSL